MHNPIIIVAAFFGSKRGLGIYSFVSQSRFYRGLSIFTMTDSSSDTNSEEPFLAETFFCPKKLDSPPSFWFRVVWNESTAAVTSYFYSRITLFEIPLVVVVVVKMFH